MDAKRPDAKRREELRGFIKGGASRPWVSTTELLSLLDDAERVEQAESIIKAFCINWDADDDFAFDDALTAARDFVGLKLRGSHD